MAAEVRCPNNHSLTVERQHGLGRLIALLFVPLGVGLPIFLYMSWRPPRVGDSMRCRLCQLNFTLTPALIGFPRARATEAPIDAPGRFAPLFPWSLTLAAVLGFAWLWLLLSLGLALLPPPSQASSVAAPPELADTAVQLAASTPSPTSASPAFTSYWVKNYELTEMWSGPAGQAGSVSFGVTSSQFCVFLVVRAQDNSRLYVLNPYTNNYLWIDASAVGPSDPPPRTPAAAADEDTNCSDVDPR